MRRNRYSPSFCSASYSQIVQPYCPQVSPRLTCCFAGSQTSFLQLSTRADCRHWKAAPRGSSFARFQPRCHLLPNHQGVRVCSMTARHFPCSSQPSPKPQQMRKRQHSRIGQRAPAFSPRKIGALRPDSLSDPQRAEANSAGTGVDVAT